MTSVYLYDQTERMLRWAEASITNANFRDDAKAIGHERDGELAAVVVYNNFTGSTCTLSLASDGSRNWFTREFGIRTMAYPFIQLKLRHINAFVSECNDDSMRFSRHWGWVEEGRMRQAGRFGEDVIVFGMLRHECRWLMPRSIRRWGNEEKDHGNRARSLATAVADGAGMVQAR